MHRFDRQFFSIVVAVALVASAESASAITIAGTDFTGRTVSGATASNITWITNGVQDPGDLTTDAPDGLFDTTDAQGHFAPDRNIGNEGPWSVTIPLVLTADFITLEDVILDWQHFNNSGGFQTSNRSADWTATVTGSSSGFIDDVMGSTGSGTSGILTLSFASPLVLPDNQTYELELSVVGTNNDGNNTGLDALTITGTTLVIPEPSSAALALIGMCGGLAYRRRQAGRRQRRSLVHGG